MLGFWGTGYNEYRKGQRVKPLDILLSWKRLIWDQESPSAAEFESDFRLSQDPLTRMHVTPTQGVEQRSGDLSPLSAFFCIGTWVASFARRACLSCAPRPVPESGSRC